VIKQQNKRTPLKQKEYITSPKINAQRWKTQNQGKLFIEIQRQNGTSISCNVIIQ
jgi:hypothetical protein